MKLTPDQFKTWDQKQITLLGMAGAGKTALACLLRRHNWFHYSADYRIGTRYLGEPILDEIKLHAMRVPFLRDLLRSDAISIANNITVDGLKPVLSFLGRVGNPERGGLSLEELQRRQALYREAEIAAMHDVPAFIRKARDIYGYQCFVNDASGSICDLDDPGVIRVLAEHTVIVYIQMTEKDKVALIERAAAEPRPLYFRPTFLEEQLAAYMQERGLAYVALIDPDDFMGWVFPRLYRERLPRYEEIARAHGYTVTTEELARVRDERGFIDLVVEALCRAPPPAAAPSPVASSAACR
jgi:hypothetical protein